MYNDSLDDIDIWPGGLAETTSDGPGELFRTIISDQFTRIRDADRFWYENELNGYVAATAIVNDGISFLICSTSVFARLLILFLLFRFQHFHSKL